VLIFALTTSVWMTTSWTGRFAAAADAAPEAGDAAAVASTALSTAGAEADGAVATGFVATGFGVRNDESP